MRLVVSESLSPGMEIGEPVHGSSGQLLLAPGVKLNDRYVHLLRKLNIPATYISDPETSDIAVPQPIEPRTRAAASRALAESFERLMPAARELRKQCGDVTEAQASSERFAQTVRSVFGGSGFKAVVRSVESVITDLLDERVLVGLNTIKTHDAYTFQHSIDVTIMGIVLAKKAGWDAAKVRLFGIGCMLHDIGKILIPEELLTKSGRLTEAEFEQMKRHPSFGYSLVKAIAPSLGSLVPQVAMQHHERQDGSGYPHALKGANVLGAPRAGMIHDFGALCAVADVYDAMASTRPYRKAWAPDQVVQTITGLAGEHLNREAVAIFQSVVAPYPVCSEVTVLTGRHVGRHGIVVKVNPHVLSRPLIRILFAPDGTRVDPYEIDLNVDQDVTIRSTLSSEELPSESMGGRRRAPRPVEPLPREVVVALRETRDEQPKIPVKKKSIAN